MGCCYVEITRSDGKVHCTTLDATSLYDAAEKAARQWMTLWWYSTSAPITVKHGEQSWTISQDRMREWRAKRA